MTSNTAVDTLKQGPIDIIKHRFLYILISAILLVPGLVFMGLMIAKSPSHMPLKLGIDFTGGTIMEYAFKKPLTLDDANVIRTVFEQAGYPGAVVQLKDTASTLSQSQPEAKVEATPTAEASTAPTAAKTTSSNQANNTTQAKQDSASSYQGVASIRSKQLQGAAHVTIEQQLTQQLGELALLQKNSIGPTLAGELLVNGLMALVFAYVLIVGYLTFRFQFDYAVCAIVALLHDTLFVFGVFAALGYFFQLEVDSLFVTAILTVIGFSVHDTIVVFDRIRENERLLYSKKLPFSAIANLSINQTLARSINTSLTALFPLFTLYVFGGETTKTFILAIFLGIVVGTYSSICVASLVLAWWRQREVPASQNSLNQPLTA